MVSHLSQEVLRELKAALEEKKADLEKSLQILGSEDSFSDPDRTQGNSEDADEASEETSHLENDLNEQNAEDTLILVEKALAKMETGEYGICEVSGEPIPLERLRAFPEAPTTVEHADPVE